jgi:hypothetical protein
MAQTYKEGIVKKKKIKPRAPRDLNIKQMITNPHGAGVHKDKKKQANKDACDDALDSDLEDYLYKRLRDPYFAKEYYKELSKIKDEMIECGTYGCRRLKKKTDIFCDKCHVDYLQDPDAYK